MITNRITIKGLVQGIGYRPFVAETAEHCSITGWVRNTDGVVTVLASGSMENMERFLEKLNTDSPKGADVKEMFCEEVPYQPFSGFFIRESERLDESSDRGIPLIPADLPTCESCLRELHDKSNRRYRHPFISCTACGPRYSIIERLPYDRETISMKNFKMCRTCGLEYRSQGDGRRHAQTIACPDCGPVLAFSKVRPADREAAFDRNCGADREAAFDRHGSIGEAALSDAVRFLAAGGILAVKDIGGYHLACTPFSEKTVRQLRLLKGREKKPFAVMFPDAGMVKEYCEVSAEEEALLFSAPRPIVLLKKRKNGKQLAENVNGSSRDIGAMLPCNPLQTLLTEELGPLIMTSANASGELLIIDDDKMADWMARRAAELAIGASFAVLSHDRPILTPLDDSIVRRVCGRTQIFRRARGFVPNPIKLSTRKNIFAAGGDLKACFCYTGDGKACLSQYLGDLADEGCSDAYQKETERMRNLFGFEPEAFACDMHPGYLSAQIAREQASNILQMSNTGKVSQGCRHTEASAKEGFHRIHLIQHHEAHIASVIAEHGLNGAVLGFAFDGTGYGRDHSIWGSEAFLWHGGSMKRIAHLKPVPLISGDEGARNADTILYGYMASFGENTRERLRKMQRYLPWMDMERCQMVEKAVKYHVNTVKSSSMGRLFDAVSAILDICHYNSYEGEAAVALENLAAVAENGYPLRIELLSLETGEDGCPEDGKKGAELGNGIEFSGDTEPLFTGIMEALEQKAPKAEIARGFIEAVSDFIYHVCEKAGTGQKIRQIALSGGTFQNRILLERTIRRLEEAGYFVYINEQVPPGDGGICLGQAYLCGLEAGREED